MEKLIRMRKSGYFEFKVFKIVCSMSKHVLRTMYKFRLVCKKQVHLPMWLVVDNLR